MVPARSLVTTASDRDLGCAGRPASGRACDDDHHQAGATVRRVTGDDAKRTLHSYLREAREAIVWKLDGLSEYDVRRPLTPTCTSLLGLVKHLSIVEAWYFGKAFDRPLAEVLPWWDEGAEDQVDMWVTDAETRTEIVDRYRRVWLHADATIGHVDILREHLDGAAGIRSDNSNIPEHDAAWWDALRDRIEVAARTART